MALTKKQIQQIRESLTIGDSRAAKNADGVDADDQGAWMFYRRAQKLGVINGMSFEDFLDELPAMAVKDVFSDMLPPLGNAPGSSPPSATSGE